MCEFTKMVSGGGVWEELGEGKEHDQNTLYRKNFKFLGDLRQGLPII